MAHCKESSETQARNQDIKIYYNTDIYGTETTVEGGKHKFSKISGHGIELNPGKARIPPVLYARHQRKPHLKDETEGDVNAKLYNACLTGEINIVEDILDKHYTSLTLDESGQTPLYAACIGNQPEMVKYLINRGYDVNHQDNDGKTPLHVAFEWDEIKIAELLIIQFRASHSRRDNRGWTPMHSAIDRGYYTFHKLSHEFYKEDTGTDMIWIHLHAACYSGDVEQVKHLLNTGADVNHLSSRGFTPLHAACSSNAPDVVKCLLEHGAYKDVHRACAKGLLPLHLASANASTDTIKHLLKYGADPNAVGDKNQTALHIAVALNKYTTVKLLISKSDVSLNALDGEGDTCLHRAVLSRNLDMVTLMLQHSCDINCLNYRCFCPLHLAIIKNDSAIVEMLLAAGADPNITDIDGENSLLLAIHEEHESMVDMLLKAGAQAHLPNADGDTCLHLAILENFSLQTIKTLIQHGAPVHAKNKKGNTALFLACMKEETPLIHLLLQSNADPNICDKRGQSCLHWAVYVSCRELVQAFLDHGAHIDSRDMTDQTPFLLACSEGKLEEMKVLLQAGADLSATDADGDTALHNAIYGKCQQEFVQTLIDNGVEVNARNNKGKTPLALACIGNQTLSVKALLKAGADANIADCNGDSCLHDAVYYECDTDTMQLLVKYGADLNAVNENSETALVLGCSNKYAGACVTLLNLGADPNIADKNGATALHWSSYKAMDIDFIQQMLAHRVCVDAVDHQSRTALMLACTVMNFSCLNILLDATSDVNIADNEGDTILHRAIYKRAGTEIVQKIIDHGAQLDLVNNEGRTALRLACLSGQMESATILLDCGANPNLTNKNGDNCLHAVVWKGNLQLVQILVSHEIDINAQNAKQFTALFIACLTRNHEIAKVLMHKGANVNIMNYRHNAPLHMAIQYENLTIITDLLEHGADINIKSEHETSPLHRAVDQDSQDCMKILLKHKPDLNVRTNKGETPLHIACRKTFHDKVELLLHHGADTRCADSDGCYALDYAVSRCDKAMLDIFLTHDISILNSTIRRNETALHYYCRKGNADMVGWLLKHGVDKDKTCSYASPLDVALDNGHKNIVFALIDAGANVSTSASPFRLNFVEKIYRQRHQRMDILERMIQSNECKIDLTAVNGDHETLLLQACKNEAIDVVGMLAETQKNIGINVCNKLGKSAIRVVCENLEKANNESVTLLSMLLRSHQRVDLNMAAYMGITPLHLVCKNDSMMMANMLLRTSRTLVSCTDALGKTPLHYAKSSDMVKLLLGFGADIYQQDYFGQTPLLSSCEQGNLEVASALLSIQPDASTSQDSMGRTVLHHCTTSKTLSMLKGMENLQVNNVDIHKESALHHAVMSGDEEIMKQLLEMGANPDLLDKNQLSPLHVASTSRCFELLIQHKANTKLVSRLGCSPSDMRQWYDQLLENESGNSRASINEEGHTAIMKVLDMPLLGFMARNQHYHTEFKQLLGVLDQFMMRLSQEMKKIDPLMEADVTQHGSSREGTVVGTPDMFHFVFRLTRVADLLQPPSKSVYTSAYTTLSLRPDFHGARPDFLDDGGSVIVPLLLHKFSSVVQRAFATPSVWSDFPQLYSITKPEPDNTLNLIFHGKVFKWLPVTVRIAPAVHFLNWRPSWCNHRCIPEGTACYLLAKDIPNAPEQKQPYLFQLDCRDAEEKLVLDLPPQLKDGLKVAKLMREGSICPSLKATDGKLHHPASHFISEQMLKAVTLNLSEEHAKTPETFSTPEGCEPLIACAQLIYERLAIALERTTLMSHFVPTHDLFKEHFQNLPDPEFRSRQLAKEYCQKIQSLLSK